jgi:Kef-type K+ transport system membrane component KefB/Trk K+ transport system NAD-binding subunit
LESNAPFVPLLIITLVAAVVPIVVSRLPFARLPIVVGEILAGIVIGKSGLNFIHPTPTINFLAQFGFVFLMFLSGLEVDFHTLFREREADVSRPRWQRPVPLASLGFTLTALLAIGIGFAFWAGGLTRSPILLGLILSSTSLGIVLPTLKEREMTLTTYGQTVLVMAIISDFATLLLLGVLIAVISRGAGPDLLLFTLLLAAFVVAAKIGQWARRLPFLTRVMEELSHATAQIEVRGAFALMVAWVVLASRLGVEVILGAFLAGAIISLSSRGHESPLRGKLDAIGYGFFIPIFFVMVGAKFDVSALLGSPRGLLLVPLMIVATYGVELVANQPIRLLFTWRETTAASLLLSSRLSLSIAAASIALDLAIISPAVNSAIILVAIVTSTLSPLFFSMVLPPSLVTKREGVIIIGTEQLAMLLGERVRAAGEQVTFLGHHPEQLALLEREGFRVVVGKPSDFEVLEQADARRARALVAVSNSPETVFDVCRQASQEFGIPDLIARADEPEQVRQLQALGVRVVQPVMATALGLEGALYFPSAFTMMSERGDDVELLDIPLRNPLLAKRRLRDVRLAGNALVIGLRRDGEVLVPHGDTTLELGDTLTLVGSATALREARPWLTYGIRPAAAEPTRGAYPEKTTGQG